MVHENVRDHRRQKHQSQRHVLVDQQENPGNYLYSGYKHNVVRAEQDPEEGTRRSVWQRRMDEIKKSVQAENQKYQPEKQSRDYGNDFHLRYFPPDFS